MIKEKITKKYSDGSFERNFKDGTKEKVRVTKKGVFMIS